MHVAGVYSTMLLIAIFKALRYLQAWRPLTARYRGFVDNGPFIIRFFVVLVHLQFCFGLLAHVLFAYAIQDFESLQSSMLVLTQLLCGKVAIGMEIIDADARQGTVTGFIFILVYMFVVVLTGSSLIISIICEGWSNSTEMLTVQREHEAEVLRLKGIAQQAEELSLLKQVMSDATDAEMLGLAKSYEVTADQADDELAQARQETRDPGRAVRRKRRLAKTGGGSGAPPTAAPNAAPPPRRHSTCLYCPRPGPGAFGSPGSDNIADDQFDPNPKPDPPKAAKGHALLSQLLRFNERRQAARKARRRSQRASKAKAAAASLGSEAYGGLPPPLTPRQQSSSRWGSSRWGPRAFEEDGGEGVGLDDADLVMNRRAAPNFEREAGTGILDSVTRTLKDGASTAKEYLGDLAGVSEEHGTDDELLQSLAVGHEEDIQQRAELARLREQRLNTQNNNALNVAKMVD